MNGGVMPPIVPARRQRGHPDFPAAADRTAGRRRNRPRTDGKPAAGRPFGQFV
jgi:hypothetical protein